MPKIVLASQSTSRKRLLVDAGLSPEIIVSNVDEETEFFNAMSPEDMEQFTASLMEDGGDNIKSMMSGMLKNISSMPGLQEMAGGQDIAEMMKKMMESSGLPPMD